MSNKILSGPGTFPVRPPGQETQDMLIQHNEVLQTSVNETWETATYEDDADHDISLIEILPGRSSSIEVRVTAHDDDGSRVASCTAQLFLSRFGVSGALGLDCNLVTGEWSPNSAPWNTVKATALALDASHFGVRVKGLAGVKIRWTVWVGIHGSQGR
jgi:hypothetical protein